VAQLGSEESAATMIELARMLKRRFENIITYLRHHITNSESINAKVQLVKYTPRGFRNKHNFVHAIYFHCGCGSLRQFS
jgi:transposase